MMYVSANEKAVSLNLHRYTEGTSMGRFVVDDEARYRWPEEWRADVAPVAGRRALTPPDPWLKGAWYPGGF
jgi:hypothetical protein